MRKIIYSLPSSFFFAFGFVAQLVEMMIHKLGRLSLRTAMKVVPNEETLRMRVLVECKKEVDEWETKQKRTL